MPGLSALVCVFAVVLIVLVPAGWVAWLVAGEVRSGVEMVSGDTGSKLKSQLVENFPSSRPLVEWAETNIDWRGQRDVVLKRVGGDLMAIVSGSLGVLTQMLVSLFILFYFFRDREKAAEGVRSYLPLTDREAAVAFRRVKDTIHATLYGQLLCAIARPPWAVRCSGCWGCPPLPSGES